MGSLPLQALSEPLTDTQAAWSVVATLQEQHEAAVRELSAAVAKGDEVAMKNAFDSIVYIEGEQQKAHGAILNYQVMKSLRRTRA